MIIGPATELGIARSLADNGVQHWLQVKDDEDWLAWSEKERKWSKDEVTPYIYALAKKYRESEGGGIATKLETRNSLDHILEFAKTMSEFKSAPWNHNPAVVGLNNGVYDLEKGVFRKQERVDYISVNAPTNYNPNAVAPQWEVFLAQVQKDPDVRWYLQKLLGTGLVRSISDQLFHFFLGGGANGKGVLSRSVGDTLGPLSGELPTTLFIRQQEGNTNRFSLSRIRDCRLLFASEVPGGKALEEYRVKQLTGEDRLVVEEKFKKQFETVLFATPIMMVNEIPVLTDHTVAMRRRLRVILFLETFSDNPDPKLKEKLLAEKEGILLYLIKGAEAWYKEGLGYPDAVRQMTEQSIRGSFALNDFFSSVLERDPLSRVWSKDLKKLHTSWAREMGSNPNVGNRLWGQAVETFMGEVDKGDSNGIFYRGWKVKDQEIVI